MLQQHRNVSGGILFLNCEIFWFRLFHFEFCHKVGLVLLLLINRKNCFHLMSGNSFIVRFKDNLNSFRARLFHLKMWSVFSLLAHMFQIGNNWTLCYFYLLFHHTLNTVVFLTVQVWSFLWKIFFFFVLSPASYSHL